MDGTAAIKHNLAVLKRILPGLLAMIGLAFQFTFFPQEGAEPQGVTPTEKGKLSPAPTLPRHLYLAVLRLLRPAEAAARRLIIASARGLVVKLPPTIQWRLARRIESVWSGQAWMVGSSPTMRTGETKQGRDTFQHFTVRNWFNDRHPTLLFFILGPDPRIHASKAEKQGLSRKWVGDRVHCFTNRS